MIYHTISTFICNIKINKLKKWHMTNIKNVKKVFIFIYFFNIFLDIPKSLIGIRKMLFHSMYKNNSKILNFKLKSLLFKICKFYIKYIKHLHILTVKIYVKHCVYDNIIYRQS